MTTGSRKTHDFCWMNVLTPDGAGARAFFAELLGWSYAEMPGVAGGLVVQVGGRNAGALMDLATSNMPPGTPPAIGIMIKVDSADAAVEKARSLGGRAEPAFDVFDNGRMAMLADPNGASFGVWQPKKQVGIEADSMAHGAPSWIETLTTDAGKAVKFYAELFGWVPKPQAMPGMTYTVFELDGSPVAGAMEIMPSMGEMPPHWATVFTVRDADASVRLAESLGAKVLAPVQAIPGTGRFAALQSPQGVPFQIVEYGA